MRGTYYVEQNYDLNILSIEARDETLLHYYQWVHLFLLAQAFIFYFPRAIWYYVSHKLLDFDLFNVVDAAIKHECFPNDQQKLVKYLSAHVNHHNSAKQDAIKYIRFRAGIDDQDKETHDKFTSLGDLMRVKCRKLSNSALTLSYVFVKLLYLLGAVFQIYLMNRFLSNKKHDFYGFQILSTILRGQADLGDQSDSKIFPRVTICDIKTKELSTDHLYTVQCILTFNLFNERIYAFLWFWIVMIVIPFQAIELVRWIKRFFFLSARFHYKFVKDRLRVFAKLNSKDAQERRLLKLFAEYYVGTDGVFVLRLMEHNSNALVVSDLINEMWTQFKSECS